MEMEKNLKERIDNILRTPALELDGNAYSGKYELNNVKSIKDFILKKLRNKKGYANLDTGDKIFISHNSAGKLSMHWMDGNTYQKSLVHIPQIIENMQLLEEAKPDKENSKYNKYSYYITSVQIDYELHTILSTVGYTEKGIYYDHNVFEGTPQEIFTKAKKETNNSKFSRLNEILRKMEKDG